MTTGGLHVDRSHLPSRVKVPMARGERVPLDGCHARHGRQQVAGANEVCAEP